MHDSMHAFFRAQARMPYIFYNGRSLICLALDPFYYAEINDACRSSYLLYMMTF